MPNNNKPTVFLSFCGIVIFVLGASAGFFFSETISKNEIEVPEIDPQVKVVTRIEQQEALPADNTELQSLQDKIAELEAKLAETPEMPRGGMRRRGGPGGDRNGPPDQPPGENGRQRQPRMSYQERMEKLKTEDPERYEAAKRHLDEMKEHMRAESESRKDFFGSIDTSRMTAEQKENHTALLNAMAVVDSYQQRMSPDSEQPMGTEDFRDFWEANRQMRSLMNSERRYILSELGNDCGMDGNEFADYIENIFNQTERRGRRQPPPPPPPQN